jgi:hypothetical protein
VDERDEGLSPRILFFFEQSIQGGSRLDARQRRVISRRLFHAGKQSTQRTESGAHRVRKDATQPVTQIAWTQVKSGLSAPWSCSKAPNAQTPAEPRTSVVPCSAPCPILAH